MSLRRIVSISSAGSAVALTLILATPAVAADGHRHMPPPPAYPQAGPGVAPPPGTPDMRPVWQGATVLPDERTRDAWLRECYRRTEYYYSDGYDGWRKHRRQRDDRRMERGPGYSYCEAYFDDWYRTGGTAQAYAYAVPVMVHARPMMTAPAPVAQPAQPCVETVTTEYVPVRTRIIPRRAPRVVPDKRIRIAPDKRQRMD